MSLLLQDKYTDLIFEKLTENDFHDTLNRRLFKSCEDVWKEGGNIDPIIMSEEFETDYLIDLGDMFAPNVEDYIVILKSKTKTRRLRDMAQTTLINVEEMEPEDVIGDIETELTHIVKDEAQTTAVEEILKGNIYQQSKPLPTGFTELDNIIQGFRRGELIIIAGRPGIGKTTLALNIILNSGAPSCLFSLEMDKNLIMQNVISCMSGVPTDDIKTPLTSILVARAMKDISERTIFIDDQTDADILTIKARAQNMKGVKLVIVDYLQLLTSRGSMRTRENEVAEISRSLKLLAKQMEIPVIALSQLNRTVEDRKSGRPQLSDLRESGAIEQDADKVILLSKGEGNMFVNMNVDVAKNRVGPTGLCNMTYWKSCFRYL